MCIYLKEKVGTLYTLFSMFLQHFKSGLAVECKKILLIKHLLFTKLILGGDASKGTIEP